MKPDLSNLRQRIQNLLSSKGYQPMRLSEIIAALRVPPSERGLVRRAADRLLQEGAVVRIRKDRLVLPSEADLVTGRISLTERGIGFLAPEEPGRKDIFIPAEDTGVAMHGDRVLVRLHWSSGKRFPSGRSRPSEQMGRVIRVLERAQSTLVGVLQKTSHFHYVAPEDPRFARDIYVKLDGRGPRARVGDRVAVELLPWENRHVNPEGILREVIGRADDPRHDIPVVIRKYRFRLEFPKEVLAEAEAIPESIPEEERRLRKDFTRDLVVTIDPEDARDHDDALSLRPLEHGRWQVGVHIADVSHYVRHGGALDREAAERGNSVYLPDRVIPMLPERLSNGICSLKEGVERLTYTVLFQIGSDGKVLGSSFCRSVIRSAARLTYRQALSVIEPRAGHPPLVTDPAIRRLLEDMAGLAAKIRRRRFENGSLDLDFPELKIHCHPDGTVARIEKHASDISHQLVEEYMLLANEAVAAEIRRRNVHGLYRIHETPEPEKLEEFRHWAMANGHTMGDPSQRREIQRFLKRIAGSPEEQVLKIQLLRSLKRAAYSTQPLGHFGLAMDNYTHFTSPIRRYADLVIHRILARAQGAPRTGARDPRLADAGALDAVAAHCSAAERNADMAEKEAVQFKILEYFERQMKTRETGAFDALVTEVRNFGLFVELPEFMLSGLVHVSTLGGDFYRFDHGRQRMIGKKRRREFRAGDRIRVEVARVDRLKRQVDFKLAGERKAGDEKPTSRS